MRRPRPATIVVRAMHAERPDLDRWEERPWNGGDPVAPPEPPKPVGHWSPTEGRVVPFAAGVAR